MVNTNSGGSRNKFIAKSVGKPIRMEATETSMKLPFLHPIAHSTALQEQDQMGYDDGRSKSVQKDRAKATTPFDETNPRTVKDFKKKNQQYLLQLKQKRQKKSQVKEQQKIKKQKLKDRLKDFVMTTVKKNVLDGMYDDQIVDRKDKNKKNLSTTQTNNQTASQDEEQEQSESSQEDEKDVPEQPKKKRKMRAFPYITDLTEWKKKNRLQNGQKVYIVTGGYPDLKKALKARGFVQNPDSHSPCFDFKYTLQGRQLDYDHLLDSQLVNHFSKNGAITTKVGLTRTLRNLIWINDTSADAFYPKCFDLNDEDDYYGFEEHFKLCKALSVLKIYATLNHIEVQPVPKASQDQKINVSKNTQKDHQVNEAPPKQEGEDQIEPDEETGITKPEVKQINSEPLGLSPTPKKASCSGIPLPALSADQLASLRLRTQVALRVCEKNIQDINELIDRKKTVKIVTDKEWEILAQDQLDEEGLAKKKHEEWIKSIDGKASGQEGSLKSKNRKKDEKTPKDPTKKSGKADMIDSHPNESTNDEEDQDLSSQVESVLQEYANRFPQFYLTGHNNIWILKPAGLSRGRGITCYNNLVQIQDHVKCKESQWIAQKYIENPLVVLRRKFDIRQWVMVTDFNPLTIWLFDQCYARFSAIDYDPREVGNKFIHLTNNSIGAYHKDFDKSHIKGNMFFQSDFSDYLKAKEGKDVFETIIRPQIKDIVKQSLMCAVDSIENRKNTHELFGYDFMVDERYKTWLIEINSSPAMDYSTHVTARLVPEVLKDTVKVLIDYYLLTPKKERKNVPTGKWKRIYKGVEVPQKPITSGLNLCLEGVPLKRSKKTVAIQPKNFIIDK